MLAESATFEREVLKTGWAYTRAFVVVGGYRYSKDLQFRPVDEVMAEDVMRASAANDVPWSLVGNPGDGTPTYLCTCGSASMTPIGAYHDGIEVRCVTCARVFGLDI
jgi:hypothetical protein